MPLAGSAMTVESFAALAKDLTATIQQFNRATDSSMQVPSTYLEIVITKA